jgi:hypothetical protein
MDDEDDLCKLSDFQFSFLAIVPEIVDFVSKNPIVQKQSSNNTSGLFSRSFTTTQLRAPPLLV